MFDHPPARRPRADLTEHRLAVGLAVPLHVGEPVAEPERLHRGGAERPAGLKIWHVQRAERDGDRAYPLVQPGEQRARAVPADVLEQHPPVRADGVVGELLPVDELLHDDLGQVPEHWQDGVEIGRRVGPVGVGRAGAGDRLDDEREADALRGGPRAGHGVRGLVPRRAQARGAQDLLHQLLVTERERLRDRQPGQAELLAQPRGEQHVRLPQALDPVDAHLPGQVAHGGNHRVPRGQGADVLVVRQRFPRNMRNG